MKFAATLVAILGMLCFGVGPISAQEQTFPSTIVSGDCSSESEVAELTELVLPGGSPVGADGGETAASSFTTVPISFESITGSAHSLRAGDACGEIGGSLNAVGALIIGLANDSGAGGIAYFAPSAQNSSQTDVSVFLASSPAIQSEAEPTSIVTESAPVEVESTAEPSPIVEPSPTASTRAESPGTRESPLPIGTEAAIGGGWVANVVAVNPNAAEVVALENMFNEPPEPGAQFVLVTIQATFEGEGSSALSARNAFSVVGDSSVSYSTFDPGCGVIPDDFPTTEVFSGGSVIGNVCFAVDAADVDSLVMFSEDVVTYDRDIRVWFSLE